MKVSFDFDHTLDQEHIQLLAKKFIDLGADVYVTTSRPKHIKNVNIENTDLYNIINYLGIDKNNVRFTHYEDKYTYLKDFDLHFDDDDYQVELINQHPSKCIGVITSKPTLRL